MAHTVLIIEDDKGIRELFTAMLLRGGYTPLGAPDAHAGIEMAISSRPDLILMDIQLPGMDGLEATTIIHQQPGLEAVPIIAVTGHVTVEHRQEAAKAGCVDFLGKPLVKRQLLEAVERALGAAASLPAGH